MKRILSFGIAAALLASFAMFLVAYGYTSASVASVDAALSPAVSQSCNKRQPKFCNEHLFSGRTQPQEEMVSRVRNSDGNDCYDRMLLPRHCVPCMDPVLAPPNLLVTARDRALSRTRCALTKGDVPDKKPDKNWLGSWVVGFNTK